MKKFSLSRRHQIRRMIVCMLPVITLKKQIAAKRLLRTRNTFSQSIMVSVGVSQLGCTELFFVDLGTKINGAYYRDILLRQKLLPAIRRVSGKNFIFQQDSAPAHRARETGGSASRNTRLHFSRFVAAPNSPDLHPVDYEMRAVMQRRVQTRGKSTPSTNSSRGWLKFGAALNSRLLTWLLISDAKDLELVFVRREDTSNIVFELIINCLDFVHFFVTFFVVLCLNFASLSKTALLWRFTFTLLLVLQGNVATKLSYGGKFFILVMSH